MFVHQQLHYLHPGDNLTGPIFLSNKINIFTSNIIFTFNKVNIGFLQNYLEVIRMCGNGCFWGSVDFLIE